MMVKIMSVKNVVLLRHSLTANGIWLYAGGAK